MPTRLIFQVSIAGDEALDLTSSLFQEGGNDANILQGLSQEGGNDADIQAQGPRTTRLEY